MSCAPCNKDSLEAEQGVEFLKLHVQYELLWIRDSDRRPSWKNPGMASYSSMLPVWVFVRLLSAAGCQRSKLGFESTSSNFQRLHVYRVFNRYTWTRVSWLGQISSA